MTSYEQAIRCPRCGKDGAARAAEPEPGDTNRVVTCACRDKTCSQYGRLWFLAIDPLNNVLYHTHTPYSVPVV